MVEFRGPAFTSEREIWGAVVESSLVGTVTRLPALVRILARLVFERHLVVLQDGEDASLAMVAFLVAADEILSGDRATLLSFVLRSWRYSLSDKLDIDE